MGRRLLFTLLGPLLACGSNDSVSPSASAMASATAATNPAPSSSASAASPASAAPLTVGSALPPGFGGGRIQLPGGGPDGVSMDYLLYEPKSATVWIPAGNTGSVDVFDTATRKVTRIEGFPTKEMERNGKKRVVGPSSVSAGDGVVYIGNRGDQTICIIDVKTLTKTSCGPKLDSMPDGVVYVAPTKEVWVTTPRDKSIRILDEKTLAEKAKLTFEGEPEGYAVDAKRGRFYTNLEDEDRTLAIDLKTHKTLSTWKPACGEEGPHGLRLDEPNGLLFIACSAKIETMDVGHDGAVVSTLEAGDGLDDIDFVPSTRSVYAGAGKTAELYIAHADEKGALTLTAKVPTADGARNPAVDAAGNVYLSHSKLSELYLISPAKK